VFELESLIDNLFETLYPEVPPPKRRDGLSRGYKPLICQSLGWLVPHQDDRRLFEDRGYYNVDLDDFLEYATSTLPSETTIGRFRDQSAAFYQLEMGAGDGLLEGTFYGRPARVCPIDAVIARSGVFVSSSVRFSYIPMEPSTSGSQFITWDGKRVDDLVTVTFAAKRPPNDRADESSISLLEWDRYVCQPPAGDDPEWRFPVIEGVYTDSLCQEIRGSPSCSLDLRRMARRVKEESAKNTKDHQLQYELARLALHLPTYVAFMYDLVVEEKREMPPRPSSSPSVPAEKASQTGPTYRLIKSIRIVRPNNQERPVTQWHSPKRLHAVRGHWRHFPDKPVQGHGPAGECVMGMTWVRSHMRGELQLLETESELRESRVVINVKQTLRYARDMIAATSAVATNETPVPAERQLPGGKPSAEWMARERMKLTAGLRYLILRRDGFRCQLCGASASEQNFIVLEVDHRIPLFEWGLTEECNLWTLCSRCNKGKSNRK
jgi:5-methylcytosine-specific restriction endonuclease McrA